MNKMMKQILDYPRMLGKYTSTENEELNKLNKKTEEIKKDYIESLVLHEATRENFYWVNHPEYIILNKFKINNTTITAECQYRDAIETITIENPFTI